jgi:hypothetical protein
VVLNPAVVMLRWMKTKPGPKSKVTEKQFQNRMILSHIIFILGDTFFAYIIVVISAANQKKGNEIINSWIFGYYMTVLTDTAVIQPTKILIQFLLYKAILTTPSATFKKYASKLIGAEIRQLYESFGIMPLQEVKISNKKKLKLKRDRHDPTLNHLNRLRIIKRGVVIS